MACLQSSLLWFRGKEELIVNAGTIPMNDYYYFLIRALSFQLTKRFYMVLIFISFHVTSLL